MSSRSHVDTGAQRNGRRPGLDGLRGVAILLVLGCHLLGPARGNHDFFALGSAGVTLFFVLSGFLITSLLLDLPDTAEDLGRFYARRALRLLPALALLLVTLLGLQTALGTTLFAPLPIVLYTANWAQIAGVDLGVMAHCWSLAVEEQFYLVWPVVLLMARRWRNGPLTVAVAGIAVSTTLRFALESQGGGRVYYGSDTQAASLLVGAALAAVIRRGLPTFRLAWWTPLLLCLFALRHDRWTGWIVVPTVVPWFAAVLVWSACGHSGRLLGSSVLQYLGHRSYALYLWHYPLILLVGVITGPSLCWGVVAIALSFIYAELSWRVVERPCLEWGRRTYGSRVRTDATIDTHLGASAPHAVDGIDGIDDHELPRLA